jgi:hypothetical protein
VVVQHNYLTLILLIQQDILEIEGNSLLVAERISSEEFDEIKDIPIDELVDKEILYLIYIIYDDVNDFKKGNKI